MEKVKKQGMESLFCPYEQALDLKELGFDEPCAACYGSYTHKTSELFLNINNPVNIETLVREKTGFNRPTFYVKTPLYKQAFRWFREKYVLELLIAKDDIGQYYFSVKKSEALFDEDDYCSKTYEEAELECLKKLIEIVKRNKMKQTAVEWLESEMLKPNLSMKDIFEQAKDIEMTQITEAFDDGAENHYDADLYFNKKFKPNYKNEH